MGNIPRMEMRSGSLNTIRNETGRGTADGGTTEVFHQMVISKVSIMLTGKELRSYIRKIVEL